VKTFAALVALAFTVTTVFVVSTRLSQEALAVLAGALCGVAAAIPTSLLILAVSRWRDRDHTQQQQPTYQPPATGLSIPFYPYPSQPPPTPPPTTVLQHQAQPRTFTVIGGEGEEEGT